MRQLLPAPAEEVEAARVYGAPTRRRDDGQPWVLANFVASADGSATVEGRSGPLASSADRALFYHLRSVADLVLVGAGTVRAEGYGPVRGPGPAPLAVVSASLDLDWGARLFTEAVARPVVLTCARSHAERRARAAAVADVVLAGDVVVDLAEALAALARRGHAVVLCEGGPTLLAQVVAAGLLDELCLTLAPVIVGGGGPRILDGPALAEPFGLRLASLLEEEGSLFLRYLRR